MRYILGWEHVMQIPRRGMRVGRRVAPAPVLAGTGTVHAVVPSGEIAVCGALIVHREANPFTADLRDACPTCIDIVTP